MKRRKLEHCVTTERPWTVLICPTKMREKPEKQKGVSAAPLSQVSWPAAQAG